MNADTWIAALATVLLGGCTGARHLTPTHGQSLHASLAAQRASPTAAATPKVTGLDSQEAAIISDSYRRSLAPKGTKVEEEPVIYVAPQRPPSPMLPPPSVPK